MLVFPSFLILRVIYQNVTLWFCWRNGW